MSNIQVPMSNIPTNTQPVAPAPSPLETEIMNNRNRLPGKIRYWPRWQEMEELFGYRRDRDCASDVRTALLTVAALIASATYQAVLSPPGGLWQEDKDKPQQYAGQSIMGTKNKASFYMFMIGNGIGFYSSLYMIYFLTLGFPLQYLLVLAMLAISFTYGSSMYSISPGETSDRTVFSVFVFFAYLLPSLPSLLRICKRTVGGSSTP